MHLPEDNHKSGVAEICRIHFLFVILGIMVLIQYINCCFTVHFGRYKIIFPTNALFIKTYNATICI
jgi:hypothetical protein